MFLKIILYLDYEINKPIFQVSMVDSGGNFN